MNILDKLEKRKNRELKIVALTIIIGIVAIIRGDSLGYLYSSKGFEARLSGYLTLILGGWWFWKGTRPVLGWKIHPVFLLILMFLSGTIVVEFIAHIITIALTKLI